MGGEDSAIPPPRIPGILPWGAVRLSQKRAFHMEGHSALTGTGYIVRVSTPPQAELSRELKVDNSW